MFGFTHAVLWDFKFLPPHKTERIDATSIFSMHYTYEDAFENASKLREAGYEAWVEEF